MHEQTSTSTKPQDKSLSFFLRLLVATFTDNPRSGSGASGTMENQKNVFAPALPRWLCGGERRIHFNWDSAHARVHD